MDCTRMTFWLFGGVTCVALLVSVASSALALFARGQSATVILRALAARSRAWLAMCLVFALALSAGMTVTIVMFAFASFHLLREFVTITPTRRADHRMLFWVFFVVLPFHYALLWVGWYGLFSILIPVYAFLFIPVRTIYSGDPRGFLERTAKVQWALMVCVYSLSHAPALLKISVPGDPYWGGRLLLFLVVVSQTNDAVRFVVDRTAGRRVAIPSLNDEYTWAGFAVGLAASLVAGVAMCPALPFTLPQSAAFAAVVAATGSAGAICLATIKRDRGRDGVVVVTTRRSMMDRVFPLCFAAPVFFHLVRYYLLDSPLALF